MMRALEPRIIDTTEEAISLDLGLRLERAGAWCARAVAEAWDSGRIGPRAPGEHLFAAEVAAILGAASGRASAELDAARARVAKLAALPEPIAGPYAALARDLGLEPIDLDIVAVMAAPLMFGELARVLGIIANDPGRPLVDEVLLGQVLGHHERLDVIRRLDAAAPLIRHGVVRAGKGQRPFQELRLDDAVVRLLRGDVAPDPGEPVAVVEPTLPFEEIAGPAIVDQLIALVTSGEPGLRLVLRGRPGSGRRALLAALCSGGNRKLCCIDVRLMRGGKAEAIQLALQRAAMRGLAPCLLGLETLGDTPDLDDVREVLRLHPGAIFVVGAGDHRPPLDPGYHVIDLPAANEGQRVAAWRRALRRHGLDEAPAETLAADHLVGVDAIERAVGATGGGGDLSARLDDRLRQHRGDRIRRVASRVTRLPRREELILPRDILDRIDELVSRARNRRHVLEEWGFDALLTTARGLSVLLEGSPGTGKTMIAGVVARELGTELYRIDVSRILSKWIGETERNLAEVFDAAEEGRTVLLFDEADSLFARRTEVKSSNDRYANSMVNYLLQRLDSFEGIAILTTNLESSIDPAFKRRLSLRLRVPFPDVELRERLWQAHLPPALPVRGKLDLPSLAARFELSGGYIRNAVLRAAFLAAQEDTTVSQAFLERAIQLEYQDVGRIGRTGLLS